MGLIYLTKSNIVIIMYTNRIPFYSGCEYHACDANVRIMRIICYDNISTILTNFAMQILRFPDCDIIIIVVLNEIL